MAHTGKIIVTAVIFFIGYVFFAPVKDFDPQNIIPNVYMAYHENIIDSNFTKKLNAFRHPEMFGP